MPLPAESAPSLDETAAAAWLQTEGARELALLLMGALTCAYRMGRYGVAEGDALSAEERAESLEVMKPLTYCIVKKVNQMGAQFYV
jgi:hypothetical protein